jgi:hypothetical protein
MTQPISRAESAEVMSTGNWLKCRVRMLSILAHLDIAMLSTLMRTKDVDRPMTSTMYGAMSQAGVNLASCLYHVLRIGSVAIISGRFSL